MIKVDIDYVVAYFKKADGSTEFKFVSYDDIDSIECAKRDRVELHGYMGIDLGDKPRNVDKIRPKNREDNHYTKLKAKKAK